jgi:DNA recombination protein RmuC
MASILLVVLALLLGLVIGAAVAAVVVGGRLRADQSAAIGALESDWRVRAAAETEAQVGAVRTDLQARHQVTVAQLRQEASEAGATVQAELAAAQASVAELNRSLAQVRQQQHDLLEAHRAEAAGREKTENGQAQVMKTIAPVAQQLKAMQDKVLEMERQRSVQHGELAQQIRNTQVSVEESRKAADNLAGALQNSAVRGVWGETQLRTLVESAGLLARVDFSTQHTMEAESGARRPDMVINLAGGKQMAIDAKAPFSSYLDSQREGIDPAERMRLLQDHARKVRGHVDVLSQKGYWTGLDASPEFTVAFIPNDQCLSVALDVDPSLMEYAFKQGVVLATPTNLWGLLKTVAYTWKQEVLTEDAKALFDLGNLLYDRITTMVTKIDKMRRSLETTVKDYNGFVSTLETRVLVSARKIHSMDESAVLGSPAQIELTPKPLTASDFDAIADLERPELPVGIDRAEPVDAELVFEADDVADAG